MLRDGLQKVLGSEHLTRIEARSAMDFIMRGEATAAQIAGFLIAMKLKGETVEEVAGFVESMRNHSVRIKLDDDNAVDGCGTGGDASHSFNLSTAASLVAAAAGVSVAKHGNRSVSSKCGSADLLEATGARIDPGADVVERCINEAGFGFMFAPRFHPAMKHAAQPRKELGVRTIFNILGPMTNPAGVRRQVIGVYDGGLMPLMIEVLQATGSRHVIVAHSRDGLDEFSISTPTDFMELKEDKVTLHTLGPEDVGLETQSADALAGGDAKTNLQIFERLLEGEKNAYRDATLFNAGAMVYVAGQAESIRAGVEKVAKAVDSGDARDRLAQWVKLTNG